MIENQKALLVMPVTEEWSRLSHEVQWYQTDRNRRHCFSASVVMLVSGRGLEVERMIISLLYTPVS